ncbi:MAG: CoA transferase [Chloroflexi bacterium]|nr:CoA transferase [Chloroflexota bacterium]
MTDNTHPPLNGIRIIAISQFGAGPFATMMLADLGAEVIKIEDPSSGGDIARYVPPTATDSDSLYFQSLNRGKKSITLNLRSESGHDIFRQLVAKSDAVFNNLRGDLPDRLGLTYEALKAINPAVVTCSLSGFGRTGPRAAEPGYDALVQAYAGYMALTGGPTEPPTRSGVSLIDFAGGLTAALGLVAALLDARTTGVGRDVDVALLDTGISMLTYLAAWRLNSNWQPERVENSAHQTIVPAQNFQTLDGWVSVFCAKEIFWQRLANGLGLAHLAQDARFRTFADRHRNKHELLPMLESAFSRRTTAEWLGSLQGDIPIAPVNSLDDALAEKQVHERGMVVSAKHPTLGEIKMAGSPFKTPGVLTEVRPAPGLGEHTDEVLRELLGYSPEAIAALKKSGATG